MPKILFVLWKACGMHLREHKFQKHVAQQMETQIVFLIRLINDA